MPTCSGLRLRRGRERGMAMMGYLALRLLGTLSKKLSPRRPRSSILSRRRFLKLVGRGGETLLSVGLVGMGLECSWSWSWS